MEIVYFVGAFVLLTALIYGCSSIGTATAPP
jgi:hypothetical protein